MARRRRPRLPRQRMPDRIAERYAAELVELVERTWAKFLPGLIAGYERALPRLDSAERLDADELKDVFAGMRRTMRREYGSIGIRGPHGSDVADFNRGAMVEQIGRVATVNPLADEPWLRPALDAWRGSNVALIRGMETQADAIESMVGDAWAKGRPVAELRKQLEERLGIDRRRAQLIARDQVGKLNGQLTMVRQSSLGIEKYRWMTSVDERVRQVHADRHGELFEWSTPPADGHPGMPVRCRCSAEPDIDEALDELERLGGDELTFGPPEVARLEEAVRNLGQWEPDAALRQRWVQEARAGVTAMQNPGAARVEASVARARVRQARAPVNVARQGRSGRSAQGAQAAPTPAPTEQPAGGGAPTAPERRTMSEEASGPAARPSPTPVVVERVGYDPILHATDPQAIDFPIHVGGRTTCDIDRLLSDGWAEVKVMTGARSDQWIEETTDHIVAQICSQVCSIVDGGWGGAIRSIRGQRLDRAAILRRLQRSKRVAVMIVGPAHHADAVAERVRVTGIRLIENELLRALRRDVSAADNDLIANFLKGITLQVVDGAPHPR